MTKTKNAWVATGDVNPIEHGGVWTRQDSETCYQVIECRKYDDTEEDKWQVTDTYIDMTDSWINRSHVAATMGCHSDDITPADVVSYYGAYQCNGNYEDIDNRKDVVKWLKAYGIKVK